MCFERTPNVLKVAEMLFRPSFCSNCGEKIDRADWHIWTSRRFCDLCVTEMPVYEYGPKIVVAIGIFASVVGFGSYLSNESRNAEPVIARQRKIENSNIAIKSEPVTSSSVSSSATNVDKPTALQQPDLRSLAALPAAKPNMPADETQYFCGAQTKKGTPCSRRVKGNVRCYQHQGMAAMLSGNKLKIG
ncbi:MAG: hypothetical protein KA956_11940 [Pyrinomonadaceae bacterium]|nr:hypothetical protein [Acidobacteriota bacterium]MBP7377176.1 hypothetical protein [Pyrinomonadaceae bacterium]